MSAENAATLSTQTGASGSAEKDLTFILDIEWDRPSSTSPVLPSLVGPFATRSEAGEWAALNIPNGSFECRPVAYPYMRTRVPSPEVTRP